jgi:homoserine kinase type II
MAVYTEIADEDLFAFIASYNIGEVLACKGIAEGVENTNYYLHTTQGSFILTLYEKRVNRDEIPFFLHLMQHLAKKGIICPQPVLNNQGEALGTLSHRPAALVTFLDGLSIRKPTVQHCLALGEALARLHEAGRDFPHQRTNSLSLKGWPPLLKATEGRADTLAQNLAARLSEEINFLEQNWPHDLPQGLIHADLFPDNVFFIGSHLSGLIDFYFACTDAFAYDIAICLNAWCFESDGSFNFSKSRAVLNGYENIRRLEEVEVAALPVLCRGSALRFLLTRLVDWLNVPPHALVRPKDPLEYDRKLMFHRTVKSAADYGLKR